MRGWLGRALQLEPRTAFATAAEARAELEKLLGDSEQLATPASLEAFLERFHSADRAPAPPAAAPVPEPRREARPEPKPEIKHEVRMEPPAADLRSWSDAGASIAAPPSFADLRPKPDPIAVPAAPEAAAPAPSRTCRSGSSPLQAEPARSADEDREAFAFAATPERPAISRKMLIAAAVVLAVLGGGYWASRSFSAAAPKAVETATGTLVMTSNPDGVATFVDGEPKGMTPLTLTLVGRPARRGAARCG